MGLTRNAKALSLTMMACIACASAMASPITCDFTVTASGGPLDGTVAQGDFTYDSSSITPGALNAATGLFTALHFTWNGIAYTAATANTGSLFFDGTGTLVTALFGTLCTPGSCSGMGGVEGWTVSAPGAFLYTPASTDIGFGGSSTLSLAAVPEPAGLLLVATGLALAGLSRRARRSAGRCHPR